MNSLSYERLYYYLACLDTLRKSREDIGSRRARADGLITDLLRELAQLLPEDERILVLAIVGKHERLWSYSSAVSVDIPSSDEHNRQIQSVIDLYQSLADHAVSQSGMQRAYSLLAKWLKESRDIASVVAQVTSRLPWVVSQQTVLQPGQSLSKWQQEYYKEHEQVFRQFLTRFE